MPREWAEVRGRLKGRGGGSVSAREGEGRESEKQINGCA